MSAFMLVTDTHEAHTHTRHIHMSLNEQSALINSANSIYAIVNLKVTSLLDLCMYVATWV